VIFACGSLISRRGTCSQAPDIVTPQQTLRFEGATSLRARADNAGRDGARSGRCGSYPDPTPTASSRQRHKVGLPGSRFAWGALSACILTQFSGHSGRGGSSDAARKKADPGSLPLARTTFPRQHSVCQARECSTDSRRHQDQRSVPTGCPLSVPRSVAGNRVSSQGGQCQSAHSIYRASPSRDRKKSLFSPIARSNRGSPDWTGFFSESGATLVPWSDG
jgi:hypothetical protein